MAKLIAHFRHAPRARLEGGKRIATSSTTWRRALPIRGARRSPAPQPWLGAAPNRKLEAAAIQPDLPTTYIRSASAPTACRRKRPIAPAVASIASAASSQRFA